MNEKTAVGYLNTIRNCPSRSNGLSVLTWVRPCCISIGMTRFLMRSTRLLVLRPERDFESLRLAKISIKFFDIHVYGCILEFNSTSNAWEFTSVHELFRPQSNHEHTRSWTYWAWLWSSWISFLELLITTLDRKHFIISQGYAYWQLSPRLVTKRLIKINDQTSTNGNNLS